MSKDKTGYDLLTEKKLLSEEPLANSYTPQSMAVVNKFGRWTVDRFGNMEYENGRYLIFHDRLSDDDWICHMFEKGWIDWNEFIPAYFTACKIKKIQHVKIRIFYESALRV